MDSTETSSYSEKRFLIERPSNKVNDQEIKNCEPYNLNQPLVDDGKYDEIISFNHFNYRYQKFKYETNQTHIIPYLITNEFADSFFNDTMAIKIPSDSIHLILEKIKAFAQGQDYTFKKGFIDNMTTYSEIIGLEKTEKYLLPILSLIVDDSPGIKTQFLISSKYLIDYLCLQGENGIRLIKNNVIKIIDTLYKDEHYEINNKDIIRLLYENLVKIGQILAIKNNDTIVSMILNFSNSESKPMIRIHHKILSIKLMKKLVHYLNRDCCDSYFISQLYSFSFDDDTQIRIKIMKVLPTIAEVCSLELINSKILKITDVLSKDVIWNVRKTCVKIIPVIMKMNKDRALKADIPSINSGFVEIINSLINDNQKYVRLAVLSQISNIINNLTKEELSMKLLDFYVISVDEYYDLHEPNSQSFTYDKILLYFVLNFDCILLTYGVDYWFRLKKLLINFCKEEDKQIQSSIILSLVIIAKIVGEKITVSDILPIYNKYLSSADQATSKLALSYLPDIMLHVPVSNKKAYKNHFDSMEFNKKIQQPFIYSRSNKERQLALIKTIKSCYDIYDYDFIYSELIRLCVILCFDKAYIIRKESSQVLAGILLYLYDNNYNKEKILKIIYSFSYNIRAKIRVLFVKMCKIFIEHSQIYKEIICAIFNILIKDNVIDVKIALAKLFSDEKRQLYSNPNFTIFCMQLLNKENSYAIQKYLKDKKGFVINIIGEDNEECDSAYYQFHNTNDYLIKEFNLQGIFNEFNCGNNQCDKEVNVMYSLINTF